MSRRGEQRIARRKLQQRRLAEAPQPAAVSTSGEAQTQIATWQPEAWGRGGTYRSRQDMQLAMPAIKEYDLPEEKRKAIVDTALALLDAAQERTRLAACKVLLAADALNLGRERLASEERRPGAVVNVFDRAQVLLQQLASAPTIAPIAQDAAPTSDLPADDAKAS